jgi:adenylate kinase family enzyme
MILLFFKGKRFFNRIMKPYKSKGFILEGFPRNKVEVEVLIKHNLHVDAYLVLKVEPEVAAKRVVAGKLKEARSQVRLIQSQIDPEGATEESATILAAAQAKLADVDSKQGDIMDEIIEKYVFVQHFHISLI